MTNRTRIALLALFCLATPLAGAFAQSSDGAHATGSNSLRFGDGSTTDGITTNPKQYLEEIANTRIFFDNFTLGLRYELDDPSEIGRSYQDRNFRRRWLTYRKDDVEVMAGDVSALFGRGLAVNLFESRPLNYDSWLDGIFGKSEFKIPSSVVDAGMTVVVKAVGGVEDFYPVPLSTTSTLAASDTLPMHIHAKAVNTEIGFFKHKLTLGAVFLQANVTGDLISQGLGAARQVNQPDFYADVNAGNFEGFLEWTENRTHVSELLGSAADTNHTGHALYGSMSYSTGEFGLTYEYKNYSYYKHPIGDLYQDLFSRIPLASPPEVYKDFTFTSISRSTHAVWFDDEVGMQLEATVTAVPNWTFDVYGAAASRHERYNSNNVIVDSSEILPRFKDNGFYPFWEWFAEAEWNFTPGNDLDYLRLALHHRSDVISYNPYDSSAEMKTSTTLAAKFQYETTSSQSILAILENQWAYDQSILTPDKQRINEILTLQYSINPIIIFGGILDMSIQYKDRPYHLEDYWPQGFVSFRLGQSHSVLMSYGSERGGLNCTGGICRVVPPFKGLRVTMTSQL